MEEILFAKTKSLFDVTNETKGNPLREAKNVCDAATDTECYNEWFLPSIDTEKSETDLTERHGRHKHQVGWCDFLSRVFSKLGCLWEKILPRPPPHFGVSLLNRLFKLQKFAGYRW